MTELNQNQIMVLFIGFAFALLISSTSANNSTIRFPRQTNTKGCRLPQYPTFGHWTIYERTTEIPENVVPSGTVLELSCQDDYKLDGEDFSTCIRGRWRPRISECLRTCPTIKDTPFMVATCIFNEKVVQNCAGAVEGAIARFACAAFYENQELDAHPYRLCSNGSWGKIPDCVPACGKKSTDPRLLVGGINATQGEYPWQIALYTLPDKSLICGGSLLNERVVVTAAHCVTDLSGELLPKERYMVGAGKYFRSYDHEEDFNKAQFSPVSEIFIPRQYKGDLQNYFGDIAVLVTENKFVLSYRVQPVCVDWSFQRFRNELNSTEIQYGFVTGWGFTVEYANPSSVLKVLKVPIVDERECNRKLPSDYKILLTDDKFCAGFINSSASACKGDSGGGLVYEYRGRYYLFGVVSVSPQSQTQEGGCSSQQYTLYTNVSHYTERFILDKETRFRPSFFGDLKCNYDPNCTIKLNCTVPPHPAFGRWSAFGQQSESLSPGVSVGSGTRVTVKCDANYNLEGDSILVCFNGTWSTNNTRCSKSLLVDPPGFSADCLDNKIFTKCNLIVRLDLCAFEYYRRLCCKSCTEAGWMPVNESTLQIPKNSTLDYMERQIRMM